MFHVTCLICMDCISMNCLVLLVWIYGLFVHFYTCELSMYSTEYKASDPFLACMDAQSYLTRHSLFYYTSTLAIKAECSIPDDTLFHHYRLDQMSVWSIYQDRGQDVILWLFLLNKPAKPWSHYLKVHRLWYLYGLGHVLICKARNLQQQIHTRGQTDNQCACEGSYFPPEHYHTLCTYEYMA